MDGWRYDWVEHSKPCQEYMEVSRELGLTELESRLLYNRGLRVKGEMINFLECKDQFSPYLMKGMKKAVTKIKDFLRGGGVIGIYGDYDVDGISSSALLYQFFKVYEHDQKKNDLEVKVFLPGRITDGYGLKKEGVKKVLDCGARLLITVDNGITSCEAIEYGNGFGLETIIIDHHELNKEIPNAYAILNPKQEGCGYPCKDLCGVGLVYKLTQALSEILFDRKKKDYFLRRYLDYVALGTYQDMVSLRGENRYFLKGGLEVLEGFRNGVKTNLKGILELLRICGKDREKLDELVLGYYIGPMINAVGRIGDPRSAFELLTTMDRRKAKDLALELEEVNEDRKTMTREVFEESRGIVEDRGLDRDRIIVLESKEWHPGIIGLVAQRVMDEYNRSCIVMSGYKGDIYVGSARGYGDFDIGAEVRYFKDYFIYHGGHRKAAGFSMREEELDNFKKAFYEKMGSGLRYNEERSKIWIDMEIKIEGCRGREFEESISRVGPFGVGNSNPILKLSRVRVKFLKRSRRGLDTLLTVVEGGEELRLVIFNSIDYLDELEVDDEIDVVIEVESGTTIKVKDIKKRS